jgi:hypothetical protein
LELSETYSMKELFDLASIYLQEIVTRNNIFLFLSFSKNKTILELLKVYMIQFVQIEQINYNFESISPTLLVNIISDHSIPFDEVILFKSVMDWLKVYEELTKEEYKNLVDEVIQHIRFGVMDEKSLIEIVYPTKICPKDVYEISLKYAHDSSLKKPSSILFQYRSSSKLKLVATVMNNFSFKNNNIKKTSENGWDCSQVKPNN